MKHIYDLTIQLGGRSGSRVLVCQGGVTVARAPRYKSEDGGDCTAAFRPVPPEISVVVNLPFTDGSAELRVRFVAPIIDSLALLFVVALMFTSSGVMLFRSRLTFEKLRFQALLQGLLSELATRGRGDHVVPPELSYLKGEIDRFSAEFASLERERSLSAVDAAVARMTQMLAHDVRRPFTTLKLALGLIKGARGNQAHVDALLERLNESLPRAISKVEGLIADVLEIGSSPAALQSEPCSLELLVGEAIDDVFPGGVPSNITISRTDMKSLAWLVASNKAVRAIGNILQNAKDAMGSQGGTIRIEAIASSLATGAAVRLSITNTNSHIQESDLPGLFEAFYTRGKKGGTGLGLAIVKKVADLHGGEVRCESSVGAGVTFHVTMPAASSTVSVANYSFN